MNCEGKSTDHRGLEMIQQGETWIVVNKEEFGSPAYIVTSRISPGHLRVNSDQALEIQGVLFSLRTHILVPVSLMD